MGDRQYKGLIIQNNPFSYKTGNGKTLAAMFAQWNCENLAQIFTSNLQPDFSICKRYFKISDSAALKSFISHRVCGTEITAESCRDGNSKDKKKDKNFKTKIQGWLSESPFISVIRNVVWQKSKWNNEILNKWLDDIQPQFVFLSAGNISVFYDMALFICNKFQIPLFLHIGDDYFIYRTGWNPWINLHRRTMSKKLEKTIKQSFGIVAICDKMARVFGEKYGGKYSVCMNSVEVQELEETGARQEGKDIELVYAGNLGINRWKVLKLIGQALAELAQEGISARLSVYSSFTPGKHILKKLTIPASLQFCGSLYGEALDRAKKDADILVHVEAFDKRYRQLTYTAMSTKVPEYMGSGRLILAVGPAEAASIEFLDQNNVALLVTERSKEAVKEQIRRFVAGGEELDEMRERAVRIARERFSREKSAEQIYNLISEVCDQCIS